MGEKVQGGCLRFHGAPRKTNENEQNTKGSNPEVGGAGREKKEGKRVVHKKLIQKGIIQNGSMRGKRCDRRDSTDARKGIKKKGPGETDGKSSKLGHNL